MKVEMMHTLARLLSDVGDYAIALNPLFSGNFGNDLENMGYEAAVASVNFGYRANVRLGNHQEMGRCLRRNVIERIAKFVFIDLIAGDFARNNFAE